MPIDEKIKEELKNKLLEEKGRLEKELSSFARPTGVPGSYETKFEDIGTDPDENASEVEAYADNLALENNLEKQLREINEALDRMDKGTYGICDNCRQEIGLDRLRAYPAAIKCLKCG